MSTYFSSSITIGITNDFKWLSPFIEAIYEAGEVYVHPFDKPREWNGQINLAKDGAYAYFERYIKQLQTSIALKNHPPSIYWTLEGKVHRVDIYSQPGYITWSIFLSYNKIYKDTDQDFGDFEYYLRLLFKVTDHFPILNVWAGCDDSFSDLDWCQKEGNMWGFRIQDPQPNKSFQMLDVILHTDLEKNLLTNLITKATAFGYQLFPKESKPTSIEETIESFPLQRPFPIHWAFICDNVVYEIKITEFIGTSGTRLLFRTQESEHTPHIDRLVTHALNIASDHILLQIASFDSRYNYFWQPQLLP